MEDLITQVGMPIIMVLVPLAVAAFKKAIPSIPKWALPILATALGPVFDLAIQYVAGLPSVGAMAALAGLAGVGLRELKDQAGKALQS